MLRKVPLIVILGSTGTGKTKLSLELAERFGGEIISADSMQVYANLDIVTAKATHDERQRVKHHLLDVANARTAEPFTVVHFRNAALPIIEKLLAQSKCPIVVGGTNYYIESLLWDILVSSTTSKELQEKTKIENTSRKQIYNIPTITTTTTATTEATKSEHPEFISAAEMSTLSSELLHKHLKRIDVESANRIHPNNKRKIVRAIEVFQETGQTLSSKLHAQRQQPGGNRLGGPLRYPHTILFWLRCQQDVLDERLDKRVDGMLKEGLLREVRAFHNEHKCGQSADNSYTKGVLQTIGFKEFIPYLEQFNAANDQKIEEYLQSNAYKMPTEEQFAAWKSSIDDPNATEDDQEAVAKTMPTLPVGLELLNACLNELKLVTRRYSKKQIKWINNRFLSSKDRQVPPLYALDSSDVSAWNESVYQRAVTVVDCYRNGEVCEVLPLPARVHPGAGLNEETSNFCEICQRHFIGEFQWQLHLKSNKHKKRKESLRKKNQGKEVSAAALKVETESTIKTEN